MIFKHTKPPGIIREKAASWLGSILLSPCRLQHCAWFFALRHALQRTLTRTIHQIHEETLFSRAADSTYQWSPVNESGSHAVRAPSLPGPLFYSRCKPGRAPKKNYVLERDAEETSCDSATFRLAATRWVFPQDLWSQRCHTHQQWQWQPVVLHTQWMTLSSLSGKPEQCWAENQASSSPLFLFFQTCWESQHQLWTAEILAPRRKTQQLKYRLQFWC